MYVFVCVCVCRIQSREEGSNEHGYIGVRALRFKSTLLCGFGSFHTPGFFVFVCIWEWFVTNCP